MTGGSLEAQGGVVGERGGEGPNIPKGLIIIIIFIYLPSDVISQEKTATSSRFISKASKYAIPLKPTHKLAESKRYLVTW